MKLYTLEDLEDALLFARENNSSHVWKDIGLTVDTSPPFDEKVCSVCGAVNWGGKEDGICFGSPSAEKAITSAHNRRAIERRQAQIRSMS